MLHNRGGKPFSEHRESTAIPILTDEENTDILSGSECTRDWPRTITDILCSDPARTQLEPNPYIQASVAIVEIYVYTIRTL